MTVYEISLGVTTEIHPDAIAEQVRKALAVEDPDVTVEIDDWDMR